MNELDPGRNSRDSRARRSIAAGTSFATHPGMAFRVETAARAPHVEIVCQGHLDAEAMSAIERGWAAAEVSGQDPVIRVCHGTTADRPAVTRLGAYPVDRLRVESPFLRSWLDEVRALRTRGSASDSGEHPNSGSERR